MSSHDSTRYAGPLHRGDERSSPYPVSRLAPAFDLVDLAKEIAQADGMVQTRASAQLQVIANQVKALQEEARKILQTAHQDHALHHARCVFKRRPGCIYHLYRKPDGQTEFSMLSPEDLGNRQRHAFVGSYPLENDLSWTPVEDIGRPDDTRETVQQLLGQLPEY